MLVCSRRTGSMVHCTVYCPIGLLAGTLGKLSPFRLRILKDACTDCGACTLTCRYDALRPEDIRARRPGLSCTLCGDCLAACAGRFIEYRLPGLSAARARTVFLVLIVSLHAVFLGVARNLTRPLDRRPARPQQNRVEESMALVFLAIYPLGTGSSSISDYIAGAERILRAAGLKHEISPMGTTIEGDLDAVLQVVRQMHEHPFTQGAARVATFVSIDDRRDRPSHMEEKVRSVEDKLRR